MKTGPSLPLLAGAVGGAVAIGAMQAFAMFTSFPLFAVPFATSIVLVMGSPDAEPAQPRALIGGHIVSTGVGLVVLAVLGSGPWAAALAVGLAILAMQTSGTFHPPAGIDPLLVVANGLSWSYLAIPVGVGAVLLAAFAFVWHRAVRQHPWPARWW